MSEPENPDSPPAAESINRARRRLLTMAKYVPPTVIGIIALQQAGCQPSPSCGPNTNPCGPNGNPCGPDNCPPPPLSSDPNTQPASTEADTNSGS